ncbi:pirin family protein [Chishuiella changwenlii]|uniref:pirin family protein n=1 Tax=Chishuiella changwenlii TaxID=1434701 RepID=UPI002FDA8E3F
MIKKISISPINRGFITILYPGSSLSSDDSGIGSIGRIDHAKVSGNHIVPMHPHINDEILSYFRTGKAEHKDSEGFSEIIGKDKLMLMKAGKLFYHEEQMIDEHEPLEGLQIFIRPGKKDLKPEVVFLELENLHSLNEWRLIASPSNETKFQFSSQTWIYDIKLEKLKVKSLPELARENLTCLLYVFKGDISVTSSGQSINLTKKESALIKDENINIIANEDSELVLFVTDEAAEIYKDGMYSGNQI